MENLFNKNYSYQSDSTSSKSFIFLQIVFRSFMLQKVKLKQQLKYIKSFVAKKKRRNEVEAKKKKCKEMLNIFGMFYGVVFIEETRN